MNATHYRFISAATAGVIVCSGAIATATASQADTSSTPSPPSTSITAPTTTSTAPSTSPSRTARADLTITPAVWDLGGGQVKVGFKYDGTVFAGTDPMNYTSSDTIVDGKIFESGDGGLPGPDSRIRAVHGTWVSRSDVDGSQVLHLAPGVHALTVRLTYPTGPTPSDSATITVSKHFTVNSGVTTPPTAPSGPSSSQQPSEPPTPSPVTTQLGVTG